MHANYFRVGGVAQDLPKGLLGDIHKFINSFNSRIEEIEELLSANRIWRDRVVNVGCVSARKAIAWGFSGVMVRGSGVLNDLRINQPYEVYSEISFNIPIGQNGDCFDRYLIRIAEMRESLKIIEWCINSIAFGPIKIADYKFVSPPRVEMKNSMEALIHHFKLYTAGFVLANDDAYSSIEAPKGEFGVYLVSDGLNKPYRVKVRSPGFLHLQGMKFLAKNHLLADIVTIIGTSDIVFGEVDR